MKNESFLSKDRIEIVHHKRNQNLRKGAIRLNPHNCGH